MSRTTKIRQPNVQCDLTFPDDLTSIYVDDLSQLMLGVPVSKVLFHTNESSPKQEKDGSLIEQRTVVLQITIPTLSLINFAKHVLSATTHNSDQLERGYTDYAAGIKKALKGLTITPVDVAPPEKL